MKRSGPSVALCLRVSLAAILLLLAAAMAAFAGTPLLQIFFTPDIPVIIGGGSFAPNQVVADDLACSVTSITFPAVPGGVHITGYHQTPDHHQLLSFDSPVTLPSGATTITITPRDVASFDGTNYSLYFSGAGNDIPAGAAIDALTIIGGTDLALSLDIPVELPGPASTTITAYPSDLVRLNGTGTPFQIFFDGRKNGVPAGVNLVGADYLSNGHLLLVFDGTGSVGGENFTPQDVLEFVPSGGDWSLAYDAETAHPGFAPAHLQGVFALEPATPTPTVTATATAMATATTTGTPTPTIIPTPTVTPTATPTVVPVNVSYSPVQVVFPNEPVGVTGAPSRELHVTLHNPVNRMKAAIVFGTPQTTSNEFEVSSNKCSQQNLAPGKSCTIGVRFMPAALGRRTGSLEIANNARNSPQRVSLVGTGVRPVIGLRPGELAFGRWPVGFQSNPKTFAIINRSPVPVQIENVEVTGTAGSEFIVMSECPSPLGALAQCSLSVSFKPAKKGLRSARITITDVARGSPQHVYLYGTGKQ